MRLNADANPDYQSDSQPDCTAGTVNVYIGGVPSGVTLTFTKSSISYLGTLFRVRARNHVFATWVDWI
jgi:hypothetical protein